MPRLLRQAPTQARFGVYENSRTAVRIQSDSACGKLQNRQQDRIDRGEFPSGSTRRSKELVKGRRCNRKLEAEVKVFRQPHELLSTLTARLRIGLRPCSCSGGRETR